MRYHGITRRPNRHHLNARIQRASASIGLKSGFVTPARRAATPYVVDYHGLAWETIGDEEFKRTFSERTNWCQFCCLHDHEIEPIRDNQGRLSGRRFRFA